MNDNDEIWVSENLIADGTSKFDFGYTGAYDRASYLTLNGKTKPQYILGNTETEPPFTFSSLRINKGDGLPLTYTENPYVDLSGVVYMNRNVGIKDAITGSDTPSELLLINGVLHLGTDTLSVGANFIRRDNGAIDGAEGTYRIAEGHQKLYIEDELFRIKGTPTL